MLNTAADPRQQSTGAGRTLRPETILPCFAGLETACALLLAVSGGPDSMALLLTAARWKASLGADAPAIHVATVDHCLRPEGRAEAERVAAVAADLELPHTILTWTGPKPSTRIQEKARAARYALLADHACALGADHVLTAHHADDQAETVLLRLGRGSGIAGLGGMRRITSVAPGVSLVRPFLDLTKADLVAICRAEVCQFTDDPSNRDPAFARARIRGSREALAGVGLDTHGLVRLSRRMARADAAIEAETDRVESALAPERGPQVFRADLTGTCALEPEIALRLLGRAVAHVAGDRRIRLERLEALGAAISIALKSGTGHRGTFAGTRVVLGPDRVLTISAEPARRRGRAGLQVAARLPLRPN